MTTVSCDKCGSDCANVGTVAITGSDWRLDLCLSCWLRVTKAIQDWVCGERSEMKVEGR